MSIRPSRDNRLLESAFHKSGYSRSEPTAAVAVLRLTPGFTLPELMVVLAIVSVMMIAGMVGYNHYREQYAFSGAVRELTHAITAARVRAMQTQSPSRLIFRPIQANPVRNWKVGIHYNIGDIVQDGPWTYRCIFAHTSTTTDEPAAGDNWRTNWEIIFDYQYNETLVDLQLCTE